MVCPTILLNWNLFYAFLDFFALVYGIISRSQLSSETLVHRPASVFEYFSYIIYYQMSSMLGFDAMTLGNHEFDDGVSGLKPFLKNKTCPLVVSNMNFRSGFSKRK